MLRSDLKYALLTITAVALALGQPQISLNKEVAIGKQLVEEFRRKSPSIEDARLLDYLTRLVDRLNAQAHSPFPLVIDVTYDNGQQQVLGLPGGSFAFLWALFSGPT